MSNRLATRIGLLVPDERPSDARDVVRFREPSVGAEARSKGSLFLLAQISGGGPAVARTAAEALEAMEHDYYYDLSAGTLGVLSRTLASANRRFYHVRGKLGIPRRAGVSIIAVAIHGRELSVAKLGPAAAVIVRGGRMYELPPPPAVHEEDPRVRQRRVAATLGEALEIEPYTWQGELAANDRIALVSRNLAQVVGVDQLQHAISTLRPAAAVEHLQQLFGIRGGRGSDGILAIEIVELGATVTTHVLEPVRAAEPLAGLPDQSPVPLADALGRFLHRIGDGLDALQALLGRFVLHLMSWILAFVPRRRAHYPKTVARTAVREAGRRRRLGLAGMVVVAALLAAGGSVASLPNPKPTDAIPRAAVAREAIASAQEIVAKVDRRIDGQDLVDRAPDQAKELLADAFSALNRANAAGVPSDELEPLQRRVDRGLDALYRVARIGEVTTIADLATAFEAVKPFRMVAATDGSLWIAESGRGRVIRVDPATGKAAVVYRAGQTLGDATAGEPWLIATAATDVVVVDRQRQAWRIDLEQLVPHRMPMDGIDRLSSATHLLAALQHRPPLEIFNLYAVDATSGDVLKWAPQNTLPVTFRGKPQPYLSDKPDLPAAKARDLRVDANLWLLQARTVTRVNFGTPLAQADYSLDAPPDAEVRPDLDYRLLDGATVGDLDYLYVYDAANARIIAFGYADGAFVRQWMAPRVGRESALLDDVIGFEVTSAPDGPPAAFLLTPDRVVRVVLE